MYHSGYVLSHDSDFDNAMWLMIPVEVYRNGELVDRGIILRHSEFCVRFAPNDRAHVKTTNEFRIITLQDLQKDRK